MGGILSAALKDGLGLDPDETIRRETEHRVI